MLKSNYQDKGLHYLINICKITNFTCFFRKHQQMLRYIITILCIVYPFLLSAQSKKSADALRIDTPIHVDAVLDEDCYLKGIPAHDFLQIMPFNGKPALQKTEVWFFYDHSAVYVGAMLYDTSPDSIYNYLTERDEIGMSDYFGVYFDPYDQGQLAYGFFITPAGVQTDMKAIKGEDDEEDDSWDAVWESATTVTDKGWVIEMRIPYSALRIPDVAEHTWGLNMFRNIRRYSSNNSWNLINREVSGFIDQQGELKGIRDIKPPVRLSLSPYGATYLEMKDKPVQTDFVYKGGMDLKYGINESYTLDMMLIPDFGQIQSDDKELNLSPYELYYDEKRQFFTEGTEMFNRAGIFYSRRIGAAPKFIDRATDDLKTNEVVDYSPSETQLLNATKISGRNSKGNGIGVLNAMSLPSYASVKDTLTGRSRDVLVQPFTNYNVSVFDKSLKNNSYVSIINTNVAMAGDPFISNSTAYDFLLKNKKKTYSLRGIGGMSYRKETDDQTGYGVGLNLDRIQGKFIFGIGQSLLSDQLNISDLGYLRRNNEVSTNGYAAYNITEPFSIFKEIRTRLKWTMTRIYDPWALGGHEFDYHTLAVFKNNYVGGIFAGYNTRSKDFYEPHKQGRWFNVEPVYYIDGFFASDSRKKLQAEIEVTRFRQLNTPLNGLEIKPESNLRLGQKFNLELSMNIHDSYRDHGFADMTENEDTIYFSLRNVHSIENVAEASYVLNNRMGISLRVRHYWSGDKNLVYYILQPDGSLKEEPAYTGNLDQNYNAFNVDMRFRWIFAPGSELSLAWKNTIYDDKEVYRNDYFGNLSDTWNLGQTNSISLKILYYIDYNRFFRN
jgi:hypothetical protein